MELTDCTPGRGVVYRPHPGANGEDGEVIRTTPGGLVFVRYRGDANAKATRPADLEPLHEEARDANHA